MGLLDRFRETFMIDGGLVVSEKIARPTGKIKVPVYKGSNWNCYTGSGWSDKERYKNPFEYDGEQPIHVYQLVGKSLVPGWEDHQILPRREFQRAKDISLCGLVIVKDGNNFKYFSKYFSSEDHLNTNTHAMTYGQGTYETVRESTGYFEEYRQDHAPYLLMGDGIAVDEGLESFREAYRRDLQFAIKLFFSKENKTIADILNKNQQETDNARREREKFMTFAVMQEGFPSQERRLLEEVLKMPIQYEVIP